MKNVNHCVLRYITLISVSKQGILLLFETTYEYFDPPTHQKHIYIYIYIYIFHYTIIINFILFLHITFF